MNIFPRSNQVGPRPFSTYYYDSGAHKEDWKAKGRAKTVEGSVIAATRHILDRQADFAVIYDKYDLVIRRVTRRGVTVTIQGA